MYRGIRRKFQFLAWTVPFLATLPAGAATTRTVSYTGGDSEKVTVVNRVKKTFHRTEMRQETCTRWVDRPVQYCSPPTHGWCGNGSICDRPGSCLTVTESEQESYPCEKPHQVPYQKEIEYRSYTTVNFDGRTSQRVDFILSIDDSGTSRLSLPGRGPEDSYVLLTNQARSEKQFGDTVFVESVFEVRFVSRPELESELGLPSELGNIAISRRNQSIRFTMADFKGTLGELAVDARLSNDYDGQILKSTFNLDDSGRVSIDRIGTDIRVEVDVSDRLAESIAGGRFDVALRLYPKMLTQLMGSQSERLERSATRFGIKAGK